MEENWFLEGLKWDDTEFDEAKNKVRNGSETDDYEILKVWGRSFFEESNGIGEYTSFLRDILPGDDNPYSKERNFLRKIGIAEQETRTHSHVRNWFFSHCWMIKGGDDDGDTVTRGSTSRMPRNLLYCKKNSNFDPEDEHFTDEYFIRLLSNDVLFELLYSALHNLEYYPLLKNAIQRFESSQDRISGSAGWYLRVNGNEAKLALGITNIDYPDNYNGEKCVIINKNISGKITDEDSVFISIEKLKDISPEEELKPKFSRNGHEQDIEAIDTSIDLKLGEINKCLASNYLFFQVPSDPQIRDYRSIDFNKKDIYNRRFIWFVGKKKPVNSSVKIVGQPLQLMGYPDVVCWKCELTDIDDKVRSFTQSEGYVLFKYQLGKSITYSGFDEELSDATHEWCIFTGDSAKLISTNNDEWQGQENWRAQGIRPDAGQLELSEDKCTCIVKISNDILTALECRGKRKTYKILHIPKEFKKKIQDCESFETGQWSYIPDKDEHIDKIEHINRYRKGLLKNSDGTSIPIHCDMPGMQPIAWIEPGIGGFEGLDASACAIPQTFNSYSDLAGKYLCIAPVCNSEPIVINHSDGTREEKTLQPGRDGIIRDEICHFMAFKGTIDQNAYDRLFWGNQKVLEVRCCPSKPTLFKAKDGNWHLYVPRTKRNGYQVFFLSEKYLETLAPTHFDVVPCSEILGESAEESVELTIPESLPKAYAVHACILPQKESQKESPDVLNMNNDLEKVREATTEGTSFDNQAILSVILNRIKFNADFSDARRYVAKSSINSDIESFWKTAVGKISPGNLSEDIVFCMNQMLQSGYNFLCEPLQDDDRKGDYGKTWLSSAFEVLTGNVVEDDLKTQSFKLDKLKEVQKRKYEPLLKAILDNQDVKNSGNYIKGEGWFPPICALHLLYDGNRPWAEVDLTKTAGERAEVQILLENSGIKALTNVADIFRDWNIKIKFIKKSTTGSITKTSSQEYDFSRNTYSKLQKGNFEKKIYIILPNREDFQSEQDRKFQRDEVFYPEEVIFESEEFEKAINLTKGIIQKCENGKLKNARVIGKHLLTLFQWVCDNVSNHYHNEKEDVEHCTMGIIAIACRLVAHIHSDELITDDEYKFMLNIVKKTFDEKFNTRHDKPESERHQAAIARWRYLMRCIVSVEVTIAFYNVPYTGTVIQQKENRSWL